jgi:hypothetical protein
LKLLFPPPPYTDNTEKINNHIEKYYLKILAWIQ